MLVVVSDTHGTTDARLHGHTRRAVREAEAVVHAGDFTTGAVVDDFQSLTDSLYAVHGNSDDPAVRDRFPAACTLTFGGVTVAVTHTRRGGQTALSLFGRERGADIVVFGHTHRPTVVDDGGPVLLNPGSHAEPRGNRAAYAELSRTESGLEGRLRTPDGDVMGTFTVGE